MEELTKNIDDEKFRKEILEEKKSEDFWHTISDAERESIEKGLKDLEEGRVFPHSEVRRLYEKHL